MANPSNGEEIEANELLDETQRLRHKRDLLTKENEQLKSYLRLRQMESTATCEQLKSEIEQQIEQFEALGDTQTNHLETLKSFRSEIEAIQCWNAKIRNKYFARDYNFGLDLTANESPEPLAEPVADEPLVCANGNNSSPNPDLNSTTTILQSNEELVNKNNNCSNDKNDCKQSKPSVVPKTNAKQKKSNLEKVENGVKDNKCYEIITRSKHNLIINSNNNNKNKRKDTNNERNEEMVQNKTKKKKKSK